MLPLLLAPLAPVSFVPLDTPIADCVRWFRWSPLLSFSAQDREASEATEDNVEPLNLLLTALIGGTGSKLTRC